MDRLRRFYGALHNKRSSRFFNINILHGIYTTLRFDNNRFLTLALFSGSDVNKQYDELIIDNPGCYPYKLMLTCGTDSNLFLSNGETLLMIAAYMRDFETVQFLIDNGADPRMEDNNGFRAYDHTIDQYIQYILTKAAHRWMN